MAKNNEISMKDIQFAKGGSKNHMAPQQHANLPSPGRSGKVDTDPDGKFAKGGPPIKLAGSGQAAPAKGGCSAPE